MLFQYPLMDRLGLRVVAGLGLTMCPNVSVSSDGSTWFEGMSERVLLTLLVLFQYPLMDRLGLRVSAHISSFSSRLVFQYPLMDRLGLRGIRSIPSSARPCSFSIL